MAEFYTPSIRTAAQAPYETRASDARMDGKQREKVRYNKPRQNSFKKTTNDNSVTSPISINALILFIENHIEENKDGFKFSINQDIKKESYLAPWMHQNHSNNNDKRVKTNQAVNAYKHAAEANKNTYPPSNTNTRTKILDNEIDLRILIKDLQFLYDNGIYSLEVSISTAFLDSVFTTVQYKKSSLQTIATL